MRIGRTGRFKKSWQRLTKEERALARKTIEILLGDIRYPALRVKKIKGVENIWEARVSQAIRITFQIDNDLILLRNIGHHDDALNHP